jgi:hypothetical protein
MNACEVQFRDATIEADAILQIRVRPFKIRYRRGDRDAARRDAMEYARRLLSEEFERHVGRLLDCVRADISFQDEDGKECERLLGGGHWVPLSFGPEENSRG